MTRARPSLPYRFRPAQTAFQEVVQDFTDPPSRSTRSSTPNSMNQTQYAPAATAGGQQNGPVSQARFPSKMSEVGAFLICNRYHNR